MTTQAALSVDLDGLRQLVERRGKSFPLMELVQNAWDEDGVTEVYIGTVKGSNGRSIISITDDAPEGFADLRHAYTLFASSKKKADPEKRGRFNLGEKLVIALSDSFRVVTTKGGIEIDVKANTRRRLRTKREKGSEIVATLRMNQTELTRARLDFLTLIPPRGIKTVIDGEELPHRMPVATFTATLATEISDDEGYLRPTKRQTKVEVYEPLNGETPALYEMGIPVVPTGDRFHVNIMQKVPLNVDRDNVPPAFLRDVRALVLNATAHLIKGDDAAEVWVNQALEDELVDEEAVNAVLSARFGEKRAIFDPSDQEANRIAVSQGYSLIHGRTFSNGAWSNIKAFGAALPAGQVTPSPKPFHPDGSPLETVPREEMTDDELRFVFGVERLHQDLIGEPIYCVLTKDKDWRGFDAVYGGGRVLIKIYREQPADITNEHTLATVIHEFAHFYGDHLTHEFDFGMGLIAARLARKMMLDNGYLERLRTLPV